VKILQSKESWNCSHREAFSSANCHHSPSTTATVAVRGKTGYMAILLRITSSWTRNSPEEWLFRRKLPAHEQRIYRKNGYYTGNCQLRDEESTGGMGFCRKLPACIQGIQPRNGIPPGITSL
jgi:hypothetical protein